MDYVSFRLTTFFVDSIRVLSSWFTLAAPRILFPTSFHSYHAHQFLSFPLNGVATCFQFLYSLQKGDPPLNCTSTVMYWLLIPLPVPAKSNLAQFRSVWMIVGVCVECGSDSMLLVGLDGHV